MLVGFFLQCLSVLKKCLSKQAFVTGGRLEKSFKSMQSKHSIAMWSAYKQVKAHGSIAEQLDSQLSATIQSNHKFLKTIAQVTILCARQNMALSSHDEQDTSLNKGSFLKFLDLLAARSDEFKDRLSTSPRNSKYTSNILCRMISC